MKKHTSIQFVPLGGSGEIGMNMNLYGLDDQWIMIDCGVTFNKSHGIDLLMADPSFIVERAKRLAGLVLTHGHEDHLGAVAYLWPHLRCPIYANAFTAAFLKTKIEKMPFYKHMQITVVEPGKPFEVGPFNVEMIELTHSIPEQNGVILRTPVGTVFHTGDWKFDEAPQLGNPTDWTGLQKLATEGVLAVISDSTNAMEEGTSGSEEDVYHGLEAVIRDHTDRAHGGTAKRSQRLFISCFASNVARLYTVARLAEKYGRRVGVLGRSIERMNTVARSCGYLQDVLPFLTAEEASKLPAGETIFLCTGSQGEPRAALARLGAEGAFNEIQLTPDDVIVFSSRRIPGNEKEINQMKNGLISHGVELITDYPDHAIHVSGHPNRDELKKMYETLRPKVAIPVHGELQHMQAHAAWALRCGVPKALVVQNGDWIELTSESAHIKDRVTSGKWALDGSTLVPFDAEELKERVRMVINGVVFATVLLETSDSGEVTLMDGGLEVNIEGLVLPDDYRAKFFEKLMKEINRLPQPILADDLLVQETLEQFIRKKIFEFYGRKPRTHVHVMRLEW